MAKPTPPSGGGVSVHLSLKSDLWQSRIHRERNATTVHLSLKSYLWQSLPWVLFLRAMVHLSLKSDLWQSIAEPAPK